MHTIKKIVVAVSVAFAAMGAAHAGQLAKSDVEFIRKAGEAGQLEVKASELAQQRATHPALKGYADEMIQAHLSVGRELTDLANRKGAPIPPTITKDQKSDLDDLAKEKTGMDFDKEYVSEVAVDAHKDAVKLFKNAASDAKDSDVRAFAAKTLPSLQAHLDHGQALAQELKRSAR